MSWITKYWGIVLAIIIIAGGVGVFFLNQPSRITVYEPEPEARVGRPLLISGEVNSLVDMIYYRISDSDQILLSGQQELVGAPNSTSTPFSIVALPLESKNSRGMLEVFLKNKAGKEIETVKIPLVFSSELFQEVRVFFSSERLNPGSLDCEKVFPVYRLIQTEGVRARLALEELLKGPTEGEQQLGYFTSIPSGVEINSLEVTKGVQAVAKADFSSALGQEVEGSCRVMAIRSQIENTLKQFELVDAVEISIEGRTEDILQP